MSIEFPNCKSKAPKRPFPDVSTLLNIVLKSSFTAGPDLLGAQLRRHLQAPA